MNHYSEHEHGKGLLKYQLEGKHIKEPKIIDKDCSHEVISERLVERGKDIVTVILNLSKRGDTRHFTTELGYLGPVFESIMDFLVADKGVNSKGNLIWMFNYLITSIDPSDLKQVYFLIYTLKGLIAILNELSDKTGRYPNESRVAFINRLILEIESRVPTTGPVVNNILKLETIGKTQALLALGEITGEILKLEI